VRGKKKFNEFKLSQAKGSLFLKEMSIPNFAFPNNGWLAVKWSMKQDSIAGLWPNSNV